MSYKHSIEKMIDDNSVEKQLKQNKKSPEIKSLQLLLFDLGFGKTLEWERFGPDSIYGKNVAAAVKEFAQRNHISGDGSFVSLELAQTMIKRFDILDDMRYLNQLIKEDKVEERLYYGSKDLVGIVAMQTLLYIAGYANQLNWKKYGADGYFSSSTSRALLAFAGNEGIEYDGRKLSNKLALRLLEKVSVFYGSDWPNAATAAEDSTSNVDGLHYSETVEKNRPRLYISSDQYGKRFRFTKYKKGLYRVGDQKAEDFINNNKEYLSGIGLTDSAMNVMIAVSKNEGNLDAINTWDNSFMTFGMFQWTIGAGTSKGELPALLNKIKIEKPDVFEMQFGQFGIDITETNNIYGFITLEGGALNTPAQKELLRDTKWAYLFSLAGQVSTVQSIEIKHALSRLNTFLHHKDYMVGPYYVDDLVTSEFGIGLLLDNHVNRPGYITNCLEIALKSTGLSDPENWTTDDESTLINKYLEIRESYGRYPMTDAARRAEVTRRYLDNGTISNERHSFQFSQSRD